MSTDIRRYVEVYTKDTNGYLCDIKQINKIGNLLVGDIVMCYEPAKEDEHYRKIIDIDKNGIFKYEVVKRPNNIHDLLKEHLEIAFTVQSEKDIPTKNIKYKKGLIYFGWESGKVYYKSIAFNKQTGKITWEKIQENEVPGSWKTVYCITPKGEKRFTIYTGNTAFCNSYVCNSWDEKTGNFHGKGLPSDATQMVKDDIDEGYNDITWCTLADIKKIFENEKETFKIKLKEALFKESSSDISSKLDFIISQINKPIVDRCEYTQKKSEDDEYAYEEQYDYVYDEDVWDLICASDEQNRIETFLDVAKMDTMDDKIRIIYVIC